MPGMNKKKPLLAASSKIAAKEKPSPNSACIDLTHDDNDSVPDERGDIRLLGSMRKRVLDTDEAIFERTKLVRDKLSDDNDDDDDGDGHIPGKEYNLVKHY